MNDTTTFSRPPRLREIAGAAEIALPAAPVAPRRAPRTPIAKLLLIALLPSLLPPLALGFVTIAMGQPGTVLVTSVALMTSLGLAMAVTTVLTRRDDDARIRSEDEEYRGQRARFEDDLAIAAASARRIYDREARILARDFPPLAEVATRVSELSSAVWERRPADDDFLVLRLGIGRRRSCLRFANDQPSDEAVRGVVNAVSWHDEAPVTWGFRGRQTGIAGRDSAIDATIASIVLQAAAMHAPSELRICVLARNDDITGWAKWLPHAVGGTDGAPPLVAGGGRDASRALRWIAADLATRPAGAAGPDVLVIADTRMWDSLPARLAELPRDERVAVVLAASRYEELDGGCEAVIDVRDGATGRVLRAAETDEAPPFTVERIPAHDAMRAALALAPLRAAAGDGAASVPAAARLTHLLGDDAASASAIAAGWERSRDAFRLAAPIGAGAGGAAIEIDLRRDGPHALLAGTTGSGKSEFLQSLVVSLAARIPPDLLHFVLIDYKGGSAFRDVAALPHVVGMMTDLDDRIASRALISLRAELRRREHLLASTAPACANITEYQARPRTVPLANLFIIIDEFHRLVTEQPDFIDQMVQIAQQGRSLGVHLLLSTQKPSGVITDHIRANTNLRICLRVTDEADSRDVLGGPEAAHIRRDLPGRVYLRAGNEPARVAQTARISGLAPSRRTGQAALAVEPFVPSVTPRVARASTLLAWAPRAASGDAAAADASTSGELTDERALLVANIVAAAAQAHFPAAESPWREPLPDDIALDVIAGPADAGVITIGIVDEPERQQQRPFTIDLDGRHICVAGAGNTGKTNALLTVAAAAARVHAPGQLHIYGIDFAGGDLTPLAALPHCGGVAQQHDRAAVRWVVQAVKDAIDERLVSPATAERPRIMLVIDNFAAFFASLQQDDGGRDGGHDAGDELLEMLDLGRSAGVTFVVATERPDALRASVLALMQTRLALALAEPEAYSAFGLARSRTAADVIAGRALVHGHVVHEMQIALAPAAVASPPPASPGGPPPIAPLPASVAYTTLSAASASGDGMLVGLRDGTRPDFRLAFDDHLIVLGPRATGRSNALAVVATETARAGCGAVWIVNPRRSAALRRASAAAGARYAERPPEIAAVFDDLVQAWEARIATYNAGGGDPEPWTIIIDDFDAIDLAPDAGDALQAIALRGADARARLCVSADTQALRSSYPSGAMRTLLNLRSGILLGPSTVEDFDLFGTRGRPARMPVGRGYLCARGAKHAVQIAQFPLD